MLPAFQINNFKPWTPLPAKPCPPHRTLNACFPRTSITPNPEPSHVLLPGTLPPPKHHLPARPPAEVCVHVSANTQLESETFGRSTASRQSSMPHVPAPDLIRPCYAQDDTRTPTEPPGFQADDAARNVPSPSASSSTNSLEDFFRMPDSPQDNIPIDPVILANLGPWESDDLQLHAPPADGITNPETTCLYPEPPAIFSSPASRFEVPDESDGSDNGGIQGTCYGCQRMQPPSPGTGPDQSFPDSHGKHQIKRKTRKSDGGIRKPPRVRSTSAPREDSFAALRSQFTSLPLDDRLQFLSWLFEGALSHCMSDTSQTACEELKARESRRSSPRSEIDQSRSVCKSVRKSSRKGMPWSTEEVDLLVKLRKNEGRSWSDVTRVFSKQYPGRSQGAIQVYWCTTLSKKAS
ncbi:hypothetical protein ASPCAL13222 [Aspergillus calidoustus]|uniref:Uncharacterized protein n=1 Tax=Aspergillus calidoustus TaxID=454130 RepID=A0A0U5GJL3_ASPCI|nr:hypothetical protein ASPCAL13222 [Aspergillus calidoustus]